MSGRRARIADDQPRRQRHAARQAVPILDLLQRQYGMALLLITHDLGVVAEVADEVAVMYLGKIVERADVVTVFNAPKHPYTRALQHSISKVAMKREELIPIKGMVPNPYRRPAGCSFHPRCSEAMPQCRELEPKTVRLDEKHEVQCLLYQDAPLGEIAQNG